MRTEDEIRADAADEQPFSNASEHDVWAARYCYNDCVHDDPAREVWCPIITVALAGPAGRASWPTEWTRRYIRFGARIEGTDRVEVHDTTADDPAGCMVVGECTEFAQRDDEAEAGPAPVPHVDGQLALIEREETQSE